jgi:hypothetical protein
MSGFGAAMAVKVLNRPRVQVRVYVGRQDFADSNFLIGALDLPQTIDDVPRERRAEHIRLSGRH